MEDLKKWKKWNQAGFIPGSEESEKEFIRRVDYSLSLEEKLETELGADFSISHEEASHEILNKALALSDRVYGISPAWVPLFFSNSKLAPWHGGCAWIFQVDALKPTAAFLQLRSSFRYKDTCLGIYHRDELIAHELSHVSRLAYQAPIFEEIIAYQSSSSPFQKWLGPIVRSSTESLIFIILMGIFVIISFAVGSVEHPSIHNFYDWFKWVPLGVLVFALMRLFYRHLQFHQCLKHLSELILNSEKSRHLLYRLTDEEILLFSKSSSLEISKWIKEQAYGPKANFRWRFLYDIYFSCERNER